MKIRLPLLTPILLVASIANSLDFYSADKATRYTTESVSDQLSEEYQTTYRVYQVLVAATSTTEPGYQRQFVQLAKLDAESLSLIYISATASEEVTSGYHTTMSVAQSILNGTAFQISIYSPAGKLLVQSDSVLSTSQISALIRKHSQ